MIKFIAAVLLLVSCTNKTAPVKSTPLLNTYPVSKSVDEAWSSTLQFFKDKQIEVQYADKNNGYIITGPVKVPWEINKPEGIEAQPVAEVMIMNDRSDKSMNGKTVTARYKVKIGQAEGKTVLIPSIEDIRVTEQAYNKQAIATVCKSTGNFEKHFVSTID
jgi:hypothetical protein